MTEAPAIEAAGLTTDAPAPDAAPAGFWIRAVARVIDWIVVITAFMIGFLNLCVGTGLFSINESKLDRSWIDYIDKESWVSWTTTLAAFVVYHTIAEGTLGTTVGKRVLGLRVVTLELGPPSFRQAFKRSAASSSIRSFSFSSRRGP